MVIEASGLTERLPLEAFGEDGANEADTLVAELVERTMRGKAADDDAQSAVTADSVFSNQDVNSMQARANFCDFWDKFVDNAPEVCHAFAHVLRTELPSLTSCSRPGGPEQPARAPVLPVAGCHVDCAAQGAATRGYDSRARDDAGCREQCNLQDRLYGRR